MGYIVKKLKGKRTWKVQYQTYKGGRRAKDIREDDYQRIGLHSRMDYNEAQQTCKKLNAQETLKTLQEKRTRISERIREDDLILNAFLPTPLLDEFEQSFIDTKTKVSHWRTAKKLMVEIKLDVSDWNFHRLKWFKLFGLNSFSLDYVQKLTHTLNKWGKFVSYKQRTFFEPIPTPTGIDRQRIIDAYEDIGLTKESQPISPDQLVARTELTDLARNWITLSIWFGLRPSEVDSLLKPSSPKTWKLEDNVIWIYQSKLSGVSSKDRWKPIPIKYEEQLACLVIINSGNFKRPLNKTLKKYFNSQTTCYAGRKGFVDLMLSKGNSLEAISMWLGHKSLDRTWQNYKDKKIVLLK